MSEVEAGGDAKVGYEIDGIPTAIQAEDDGEPALYGAIPTRWLCPCGWGSKDHVWLGGSEVMDALRFHYAHCPKAKL